MNHKQLKYNVLKVNSKNFNCKPFLGGNLFYRLSKNNNYAIYTRLVVNDNPFKTKVLVNDFWQATILVRVYIGKFKY